VNPYAKCGSTRRPTRGDYWRFLVGTVAIGAAYVTFAVCVECRTATSIVHIGLCGLAAAAAVYGVLVLAARTVNRRATKS
jgi:hypothetical protein